MPSDNSAPPPHWWLEMSRYHWWVLLVATLGWLFDSLDQRLFILVRTPALRDLIPGLADAELAQYAGYATAIFIFGWATGGLIFGLMGDRWGRTRTMMITILLYSVFTGLSAFSTSWWDFAAYRFLCGMGIGGEYAAGVALVAEVVPNRARPYCLGLLQGISALGNISGSLISLYIGPEAMIGGIDGWRVLFMVGVLPALLVVVIRLKLREPESWLQAREKALAGQSDSPDELHKQMGDLSELFGNRRWRYHIIIGMILGASGQIGLWGVGFWTPELIRGALLEQRQAADTSATTIGTEAGSTLQPSTQPTTSLNLQQLARQQSPNDEAATALFQKWHAEDDKYVGRGTMLQDVAGMCGMCVFTWWTGRVGRRKAFVTSYLLALGATWLTFGWLSQGSDVYWMLPLLGFGASSVYAGFAIYFPELFPTRLRSTGTGFCYNVARYITALGPLMLGRLAVLYAGIGYAMPLRPAAMTLALVYLVGVIAVRFAPETHGKPLPE